MTKTSKRIGTVLTIAFGTAAAGFWVAGILLGDWQFSSIGLSLAVTAWLFSE